MKIATSLLVGAACSLGLAAVSQPAAAAAPKLTGVYAYSSTLACQARINWTTGQALRSGVWGNVLTEASTGQVVTSLTTGSAVTGWSVAQVISGIDFTTQQHVGTQVVADNTLSNVVTGGQTTTGVTGVTTGLAVTDATLGPVMVTYTIISSGALVQETIGTVSFNATTLKANMSLTKLSGAVLRKGNGTPSDSAAVKKSTETANVSYENSATTVTLKGVVHDAVYGNIVNGVARHVNLLFLQPNGCAFRATLVHQ